MGEDARVAAEECIGLGASRRNHAVVPDKGSEARHPSRGTSSSGQIDCLRGRGAFWIDSVH